MRVCFAHGGQLAQMNLGRRIQGFDGRPDLFEGKEHPRKAVGHKNIFFEIVPFSCTNHAMYMNWICAEPRARV